MYQFFTEEQIGSAWPRRHKNRSRRECSCKNAPVLSKARDECYCVNHKWSLAQLLYFKKRETFHAYARTNHSHARPQTNSSAKMPMIGSLYFSFVKKVKNKLKRKRLYEENKLQSGATIQYKIRSSRHWLALNRNILMKI